MTPPGCLSLSEAKGTVINMEEVINKTMDRHDLECASAIKLIDGLNQLIVCLKQKNLKISSWYGSLNLQSKKDPLEWINRGINYCPLPSAVDDANFPWFLYWEIIWLLLNNDFKPGQTVLDMGGSSSLFSYFLAHRGLKVTTIDLNKNLVENANCTAEKMNWPLRNIAMDMRELSFDEQFDHITSVCVFEHIPMYERVEINKGIKRLLRLGGNFSITFDYRNPSKKAVINCPEEVERQFILPSGLSPRGNVPFFDNGKNYLLHPFYSVKVSEYDLLHPFYSYKMYKYKKKAVRQGLFDASELNVIKTENDYTFGALFLENR